jgi:hypothetical protein
MRWQLAIVDKKNNNYNNRNKRDEIWDYNREIVEAIERYAHPLATCVWTRGSALSVAWTDECFN